MNAEDCNEYYRRRLNETADRMRRELRVASDRDKLIVDAIRVAANRNGDRDRFEKQMLRDAVSATRAEMEADNGRATAAVKRARCQLDHFADELRIANVDQGSTEIETAESLSDEIAILAESVLLVRQQLDEVTADIRYVESLLHCQRSENAVGETDAVVEARFK